MTIAGKIIVITGAGSGIGRALAVELGLGGGIVILAGRSQETLKETGSLLKGYGIEHLVVPCDVTSDDSIQQLIQTVVEKYHTIDIFIHNAGVGLFENVIDSKPHDIEKVFATNVWGPLNIMRQIVPHMQGGMIVSISSAAGKYAPYQQGIYAASKAALERMTEAVGLEHPHLKTLVVVGDRTATPFMQHVLGPKEKAKLALQLKFASPEQVAKRIVRAIKKEKQICYTTLKARIYTILSALFPSIVVRIQQKAIK